MGDAGVGGGHGPLVIGEALFAGRHRLGGYLREVPVRRERLYENLLDWEHLPWLHAGTFRSIELIERGAWWWRARVERVSAAKAPQIDLVVVQIEPDRGEWVIEFEGGPRTRHLVHVRATGDDPVLTEVSFWLAEPPRNEAVRAALQHLYFAQYAVLYEEDLSAMRGRQAFLDRSAGRTTDVPAHGLGTVEEVRAGAPFVITWRGGRFHVLAGEDGGLRLLPADCPHQGAPLPAPGAGEAEVVCPWHGYRFDPARGCSSDGRQLRMREPPRLVVEGGIVRVVPG